MIKGQFLLPPESNWACARFCNEYHQGMDGIALWCGVFRAFFPSLWGGIKFGLESSNWKWVKWTGKLGARKNFV